MHKMGGRWRKNYFKKLCAISLQGGNPDQERVLAGIYLYFVREHSVGQLISQGLAHLSITTLPFGLCCLFSMLCSDWGKTVVENEIQVIYKADLLDSSLSDGRTVYKGQLHFASSPDLIKYYHDTGAWWGITPCLLWHLFLFRRGMRYLICLLISRSNSKFGSILPSQQASKGKYWPILII